MYINEDYPLPNYSTIKLRYTYAHIQCISVCIYQCTNYYTHVDIYMHTHIEYL